MYFDSLMGYTGGRFVFFGVGRVKKPRKGFLMRGPFGCVISLKCLMKCLKGEPDEGTIWIYKPMSDYDK